MKVAWVTGDYPPEVFSGTAIDSCMLTEVLRSKGVAVEVVTGGPWRAASAVGIARRVEQVHPDVVHLEYPTASYGSGLAPQVLSLLRPMIIRLHEVSQIHILRRLALLPFAVRSTRLIFTTRFERDYAGRFAPWILPRSRVIPIWSQIPADPKPQEGRAPDIVYFGLFRRRKGIEQVLELARLIREKSLPYTVRMVGAPDPQQMDYYEHLRACDGGLPIQWDVGLDRLDVARLLGQCQLGYMPFPDGASERRGSLLALLANGQAVITTRGRHTPEEMDGAVEFAASPDEALQLIARLRETPSLRTTLSTNAMTYAARFSLDSIADEHVRLYQEVLFG